MSVFNGSVHSSSASFCLEYILENEHQEQVSTGI